MIDKSKIKELLKDFIKEIEIFLNTFGVFDGKENIKELAREFGNRFFSNLISLENDFDLKDSLQSVFIQRYTHELFEDFFYIFGSTLSEERVLEFFSFEKRLKEKPELQNWKTITDKKDVRAFVPPWVADEPSLKRVYKKLSNMAHPNLISMRLNRRGQEYEYIIIKDSIALSIVYISLCFMHLPFRNIVKDDSFDMQNFYLKMDTFKNKAWQMLLDKDN